MAAPITASKKPANGKTTYWLVPAIASDTAPTDDEINAAEGLNITGFMMADQDSFTASTSKVTLPRLLIETTTTQAIDETTWDMPDIVGVFDPQAAAGANDKKFWALVKDGYDGFIVRRQNVTSKTDADVTAGQFVDVAAITIAVPTPGQSATDASGVYQFVAGCTILAPKFNVAVVAGA
jgi:hypothetical protein